MCSISGFDFENKELIKKMNKCLQHRGPDDSGIYVDKHVSLGMNRLAIIDLSMAGHQPMSNKDETIWIVFNGEMYNFQDVRKELEKKYDFRSGSDTEVIIHVYEEWGEKCVEKFNGMWAFCIYDVKKKKLFLSRDRIGKKPLYYYYDRKKLIFGSEIKSILQDETVKREINQSALQTYLAMGFIPSPDSVFKKIYKLGRSENMVYDLKTKKIRKQKYYSLPKQKIETDKKLLVKKGKEILEDSVRLRKIADVEVGTFLSGGIDSSTVSTMLTRLSPKKLHTFSIGFEDPRYDETKDAELMAEVLGTKHHHEYFTQKDFEKILKILPVAYDEPFADIAAFPTIKVSEMARRYVTVALTGEGGDEIFGGYTLHKAAARVEVVRRIPRNIRKSSVRLLNKASRMTGVQAFHHIAKGFEVSLDKDRNFYKNIFCQHKVDKPAQKWYEENFSKILKKYDGLAECTTKFDLFYHTVPDKFNVKVDRAGMINSLEIRCPFLDYRFYEYSAQIPQDYKVDAFRTKKLMKKMLDGVIPKQILYKKKKGFTPPVFHWMMGEYKGMTQDSLEQLKKRKMLSKESQKHLEKSMQILRSGNNPNYYDRDKIYRYFVLNNWVEKWL